MPTPVGCGSIVGRPTTRSIYREGRPLRNEISHGTKTHSFSSGEGAYSAKSSGLGMSSGAGGGVGGLGAAGAGAASAGAGSGAWGSSEGGGGATTPCAGASCGSDPSEAKVHAAPANRISNGMTTAHQALRCGGAFDGMSLSRQSSHSPFRSSGSSCFSQIPSCSTIVRDFTTGRARRSALRI